MEWCFSWDAELHPVSFKKPLISIGGENEAFLKDVLVEMWLKRRPD